MDRRISTESTGTEALDLIIGNGVSIMNTLLVLDENATNEYYCKPIQRCYIAEGLGRGHGLFLASPDPAKIHKLLSELPVRTEKLDGGDNGRKREIEDEEFKIAWRYQTAPALDSSIKPSLSMNGNARNLKCDSAETKYDLSRIVHFDAERIDRSEQQVTVQNWHDRQPSFAQLWENIHSEFSKQFCRDEGNRQNKNEVLRILITDLSSPLWADSSMMPQFLAMLKAFCRRYNAMAMLSLDSSLSDERTFQNCIQYADVAFQLQKMDEQAQKMLCLRQRINGGRFFIHKLPTVRSAAPAVLPASLDLLFSLRRRFFEIKLLHLPPAIGDDNSSMDKNNIPKTLCQSISDHF